MWRASSFTITTRSDKGFCVRGVPLRKWKVKQPQQQRHTHTHTRREKKKELAPFLNTTRLVFFSLTASTVRALGVSCWPDLSFVLVCACAVSCTSVFFRGSVSLCLRDWRRWRPRFKVALQSALRKTVQVKVVLALQIFYTYALIESSNKHTHTQKKKNNNDNNNSKETRFFCPSLNRWKSLFSFLFFFFFFWGRL